MPIHGVGSFLRLVSLALLDHRRSHRGCMPGYLLHLGTVRTLISCYIHLYSSALPSQRSFKNGMFPTTAKGIQWTIRRYQCITQRCLQGKLQHLFSNCRDAHTDVRSNSSFASRPTLPLTDSEIYLYSVNVNLSICFSKFCL